MKKAKFINYCIVDIKRLFSSMQFYIAVAGIWGINILNILDETRVVSNTTVLYLFNGRNIVGAFEMLLVFFAVLPYSMSFCIDWDYGYYKPELIRGKISRYTSSKVIVVMFGSIIATMVGYMLFVFSLGLIYPLFPSTLEDLEYYMQLTPTGFQEMAYSSSPIFYYILTIIPEALMYGFLSCFALYISSKNTNRFIVFSAPIIFYYMYNYLGGTLKLPNILKWQFQRLGVCPEARWEINLLLTIGYYFIWIGIIGWMFFRNVRRKVRSVN